MEQQINTTSQPNQNDDLAKQFEDKIRLLNKSKEEDKHSTTDDSGSEVYKKLQDEQIQTKDQCKELLQILFEQRVRTFHRLQNAVNQFKERLSMEQLKAVCVPLTDSFQGISLKIKQIAERLAQIGERDLQNGIAEIQQLEKTHLELRVQINDKVVKLAMLDYEMRRQKFLHKSIDDNEIEIKRMPFCQEIDQLRRQESEVLSDINHSQSQLWFMFEDENY